MIFKVYNVEKIGETNVLLHGKVESNMNNDDTHIPMRTISVQNIISPKYFGYEKNKRNELFNEIEKYTNKITKVEDVERDNIFYKAIKRHVKLLKISFCKSVCFDNFESNYCSFISTEFVNGYEQIIIEKGLHGVSRVEILGWTGKEVPHEVKYENLVFLNSCDLGPLKTAAMVFEFNNNTIEKVAYYNGNRLFYGCISKDTNSKDAKYNDANSKDANSKDANYNDTNSKDTNYNDTNSKDTNSKDINYNDANSKDINSKDSNYNDANSKDTNSKDTNSKDTNSKDTNSKDTNSKDTNSKDTNSKDANTINTINTINDKIKTSSATFKTSNQLLEFINNLIANDEPDVLVFHNFHLRKKLQIGRRIVCDIYQFAYGHMKGRDFSVTELAMNYHVEVEETLWGRAIAVANIFLAMRAMSLAKELSDISGCPLNKCLENSRAERVEYTLLRELYERKFLFPPIQKRTLEEYAGGLVLNPEVGFYQNYVVLVDFNSLYPSIIQEYDVCFSTVGLCECQSEFRCIYCDPASNDSSNDTGINSTGINTTVNSTGINDTGINSNDIRINDTGINTTVNSTVNSTGINTTGNDIISQQTKKIKVTYNKKTRTVLPNILNKLVERRQSVKSQMKTASTDEERETLDLRQRALKLTANSIYGCLGFPNSRFCNYAMAEYITRKGRELLGEAVNIASCLGLQVLYGDTDSLMIHTRKKGVDSYYESALATVQKLCYEINSKYRYVEIEIERAYKRLVLYRKKRYAALVYDGKNTSFEFKGLDFVRRDYCRASNDICKSVIELILNKSNEMDNKNLDNMNLDNKNLDNKNLDNMNLDNMNLDNMNNMNLDNLDNMNNMNNMDNMDNMNNINNKPNLDNKNNMNLDMLSIAEEVYVLCEKYVNKLSNLPKSWFIIYSALAKDPRTYGQSIAIPPHAALALRLASKKWHYFHAGDIVPYFIGCGNGSVSDRACHPDDPTKIDYNFYSRTKILPPLLRIISQFPDIIPDRIESLFGINRSINQSINQSINRSNRVVSRTRDLTGLVFITDCCSHKQNYSSVCGACAQPLSSQFYLGSLHRMFDSESELLYHPRNECSECKVVYLNHMKYCPLCVIPLHPRPAATHFDKFVSRIIEFSNNHFENKEFGEEVVKLVRMFSRLSAFRKINMQIYYSLELPQDNK